MAHNVKKADEVSMLKKMYGEIWEKMDEYEHVFPKLEAHGSKIERMNNELFLGREKYKGKFTALKYSFAEIEKKFLA
jgi:hypothetical protein